VQADVLARADIVACAARRIHDIHAEACRTAKEGQHSNVNVSSWHAAEWQ
jgi:hypothetical protein